MKEKVNCVLLVDDDYATNYIHKHVIKEANFAEHVIVVENGQEALDFLIATDNTTYIRPDIIFLDVNMPIMDGWEFLDFYAELDESLKCKMMVVLLSTSLLPADKLNSEINASIDQFISKPLTVDVLQELQV
jgi:CheY-like chemotaxis protein